MNLALPPLPASPSGSSPTWTAPLSASAPLASGTPATASASVPADPSSILDQLVETVDGVRAAILASVDGFGLARSSSMSDEASHPAMLAASIGLAHQLVAMGGGVKLRQLVVDHDGGLLLVWPLGDQRVLAVLATTTVEQRCVRSYVQAQAQQLIGAAR